VQSVLVEASEQCLSLPSCSGQSDLRVTSVPLEYHHSEIWHFINMYID